MPSQTNPADRVLPLIPLRDVVVFPHMVIPLFVGRDKSIAALEEAMAADRDILLAAQKEARVNEPGPDDIHGVGHGGHHHPAPQAARRHGEGAGGGQDAGQAQELPGHRQVLPGAGGGTARAGPAEQPEAKALMRTVVESPSRST